MPKKVIFFGLIFFFALSNLSSFGNEEIQSALDVDVKGIFSIKGGRYMRDSSKSSREFAEVRIQPVLIVSYDQSLTAKVVADARINSEDFYSGGIDDWTESNHGWAVNIKEAWFDYWPGGTTSFRFGKQIFSWSVMDTVCPMDVLNARDWTFIPDWEKVGIPAANFRLDKTAWFAEVVLIPTFTPSKLPKGRWEEDLPVGLTDFNKDWNEDQVQVALRIGGHWEGFDLMAMVYKGVSYNPYGRIVGSTLELDYSELEVYAGSIVKELPGGIIGKTEFGYYQQEHGDDFFQAVVGARKEFYDVFHDTDRLSVLVQYSDEKVISEDRSVVPVTDFRRDLNKAVLSRISYNFGENSPWKAEIEGTANLDGGDYYVRPKVVYEKDNWEVEAGYQKVGGPRDSFWGKYEKVDSVFLGVKIHF